jgi:hypothetical protein
MGATLEINEKLRNLYSSYLSELSIFIEKFPNENLQGPFMAKVDGYINQPLKLMVVGQETFGWSQSLSIEDQLGTYEDFNFGSEYRSTPFWNVVRKVESALGVEAHSIAWSNLNRFDQNVGAPVGEVLKQVSQFDQILKEEIKILSPDVCFLFTNHKYDSRLNDMYEGLVFEDIDGLPEHHFARLLHPNLPKVTIRAPHPKTIRVKSWEEMFMKFVGTLL